MGLLFCNLRINCIIGGFLLLIYYSFLTYIMYYEIANSEIILYKDRLGRVTYAKNTRGFWVLGICFSIMALDSLALTCGTITRCDLLIILFLICEIIPVAVEFYYLLVALLYGIEIEFVFIYLLPLVYLIYIDVVSFFYWRDLRKKRKKNSISIDIEY